MISYSIPVSRMLCSMFEFHLLFTKETLKLPTPSSNTYSQPQAGDVQWFLSKGLYFVFWKYYFYTLLPTHHVDTEWAFTCFPRVDSIMGMLGYRSWENSTSWTLDLTHIRPLSNTPSPQSHPPSPQGPGCPGWGYRRPCLASGPVLPPLALGGLIWGPQPVVSRSDLHSSVCGQCHCFSRCLLPFPTDPSH